MHEQIKGAPSLCLVINVTVLYSSWCCVATVWDKQSIISLAGNTNMNLSRACFMYVHIMPQCVALLLRYTMDSAMSSLPKQYYIHCYR